MARGPVPLQVGVERVLAAGVLAQVVFNTDIWNRKEPIYCIGLKAPALFGGELLALARFSLGMLRLCSR